MQPDKLQFTRNNYRAKRLNGSTAMVVTADAERSSLVIEREDGERQKLDLAHLAGLQIARGLVWGALAWLLARSLSGPDWKAALLVGLAFAGLMAPVLLFPNPAMPWPVRWVHMVEIGVSNFLFGLIAAFVLRHGARRKSGSREAEALPA